MSGGNGAEVEVGVSGKSLRIVYLKEPDDHVGLLVVGHWPKNEGQGSEYYEEAVPRLVNGSGGETTFPLRVPRAEMHVHANALAKRLRRLGHTVANLAMLVSPAMRPIQSGPGVKFRIEN